MSEIALDHTSTLRQNNLLLLRFDARELPEDLVAQLLEKSHQPHIKKYVGKGLVEPRFSSRAAYTQWAAKGRTVYMLVDEATHDLAGIAWYGKRLHDRIDKKYTWSFGIRLYEGYVGKKLAKPLIQVSLDDMHRQMDGATQYVWLGYDEQNEAAGRAYVSCGYTQLLHENGRIIMGREL